jgi:hypothetical protein
MTTSFSRSFGLWVLLCVELRISSPEPAHATRRRQPANRRGRFVPSPTAHCTWALTARWAVGGWPACWRQWLIRIEDWTAAGGARHGKQQVGRWPHSVWTLRAVVGRASAPLYANARRLIDSGWPSSVAAAAPTRRLERNRAASIIRLAAARPRLRLPRGRSASRMRSAATSSSRSRMSGQLSSARGWPMAYQLAVVVDDALQEITDVAWRRPAQFHATTNTPADAGYPTPVYAHCR